jgi:disease resistance protein RPM1
MLDMILGSAQGAVDSLLGRLTSALAEEAQLLGGVRGDVHFIKDEMESMSGLLMHVADAAGDDTDEDHQVRAWMKQVVEVAYASQNCIDIYVQSIGTRIGGQGLLGLLQRLPQLVWTLPARHRIATQIRELKVRAREVGERRLRYGVEPPPRSKVNKASLHASDDEHQKNLEDARRLALVEAKPVPFESFCLFKLMTAEGGGDPLPRGVHGSETTQNSGEETLPRLVIDQREQT